jgi:copper homeostasis protein CutC
VKHILTSGGPNKAMEGLELIKHGMTIFDDVLIGAGISAENALEIISTTNNPQIHVGTSV